MVKLLRKGKTFIGFFAVAFIICAIELALWIDGESYVGLATQSLEESFIFQGSLLNGYLVVYVILNSLWVHIPFLIALVVGDLMAGEGASGTWRLLLTRPFSRSSIVYGKFLTALCYVFMMVIVMGGLSLGLGMGVFGEGDLLVMKDRILIFQQDDALWRIFAAFGFSVLSMSTVAALTFMFSSMTDNPVTPIIIMMSLIIAFMILGMIDLSLFRAMKPFFFTTYMSGWREFFSDPVSYASLAKSAGVLSAHILGSLLFTLYYFKRKDITS